MSSFKKKLAAFLAVVMAFTSMIVMTDTTYADDVASGTMGSVIQWELNLNTGKLVIKGQGPLAANVSEVLGQEYFDKVKEIEICSGITSLPTGVFANKLEPKQDTSGNGDQINGPAQVYPANGGYKPWASVEKITLPDGITTIPGGAFYALTGLKEVTIPSSVQAIGNYAFAECTSLSTITLPENLEYIGEYAFSGSGLVSIDIPDKVEAFGKYAFYACHSLETVDLPAAMDFERYSDNLFADCTKLYDNNNCLVADGVLFAVNRETVASSGATELVISEGVTTIIPYAFQTLYSYSYNPDTGMSQTSKNGVEVDKVVFPSTLKNIGKLAFYRCLVKEVEIPASVEYIGEYAFWNSENLEKVVISEGVTDISESCFGGCSKLKEVSFPSTLKYIGDSAFTSTSLTEVTIPASVEKIGDYAFAYMEDLEKVNIPKTVKKIGFDAFHYCPKLADEHGSIVINGVLCGGLHEYNSETDRFEPIYICENVTDIATSILATKDYQDVILDEKNDNFKMKNGGLYSKDGKIMYGVVNSDSYYNTSAGRYDIKVDSGCETIKYCALSSCAYGSVSRCVYDIPASVTNINDGYPFYSGITYKAVGGSYAAQYAEAHGYYSNISGDISNVPVLPEGKVLGDATSDGKVKLNDAQFVLKAALGIERVEGEMEDICDVDFSGKVDLKDAQAVLRASLGIINLEIPSIGTDGGEYGFVPDVSDYYYNEWSNKSEMRFEPSGVAEQFPATGGSYKTGDTMADKMPLLIVIAVAMVAVVVSSQSKRKEEV